MTDELKDRLAIAWKRYVRRELARDPSLGADDVKAEDVADQVAKLLGEPFSASTFSKIRSGKQQPYARQLAGIALVLGEDHEWLVGLKGTARDIPAGRKKPGGGASQKGA